MHRWLFIVAIALPLASLPGMSGAKGCLKGAAVGGVVGHVAGHHAVGGAAAGCVIGHHQAKEKERGAVRAAQPQDGDGKPSGTTPAR